MLGLWFVVYSFALERDVWFISSNKNIEVTMPKTDSLRNVEVWNFDDAEFIYQTLANTLPGAVATVAGIQKELQWVGIFTVVSQVCRHVCSFVKGICY